MTTLQLNLFPSLKFGLCFSLCVLFCWKRICYFYTDIFQTGTSRNRIFRKEMLIENDINIGIEYSPWYIEALLIQTVVIRVVKLWICELDTRFLRKILSPPSGLWWLGWRGYELSCYRSNVSVRWLLGKEGHSTYPTNHSTLCKLKNC